MTEPHPAQPDGTPPRAFAEAVAGLRAQIRGAEAVCNLMPARHPFMALLLAALAEGRTTVLPPARAPGAVAAALEGIAAPMILDAHPEPVAPPEAAWSAAGLDGAIHVFTSGSTGRPVRHEKTWRMLAEGARVTTAILDRLGLAREATLLIGTTPHQHMYGLEATVFTALAHGWRVHGPSVFYPADLRAALAAGAAAGLGHAVLVTSPAHLRYLAADVSKAGGIDAVISATAPLPLPMAERIEAAGVPVWEIFGCTEAGSIAIRRTVEGPLWTPEVGFRLSAGPEGGIADAPHLPAPVPLGDMIEIGADGRFLLAGRIGDRVNVAGKRGSLGHLSALLVEIPGVADGLVLSRPGPDGDLLHAVVCPAPEAGPEATLRRAILAALRTQVDPLFLPRSLVFVDRIVRSATGKIERAETERLDALLPAARAPGAPR